MKRNYLLSPFCLADVILIENHFIIFNFDDILQSRDFVGEDVMDVESLKRWNNNAQKNTGGSVIEKEIPLFVETQNMDCNCC